MQYSREPSHQPALGPSSQQRMRPHRRLDLTKVYYNPQKTASAMKEEAKAQENPPTVPKLFQPEVNAQRQGAQFSHNGQKCDVFEHLYREGLEHERAKLQLASPASFREHGKMWRGIKEEPRDPSRERGRSPSRRPPWVAAGSPRSVSTSRSVWKKRAEELQIEEQVQQRQRAASAPRSGVSDSIAAPTQSSQAKLRPGSAKANGKKKKSAPPPQAKNATRKPSSEQNAENGRKTDSAASSEQKKAEVKTEAKEESGTENDEGNANDTAESKSQEPEEEQGAKGGSEPQSVGDPANVKEGESVRGESKDTADNHNDSTVSATTKEEEEEVSENTTVG